MITPSSKRGRPSTRFATPTWARLSRISSLNLKGLMQSPTSSTRAKRVHGPFSPPPSARASPKSLRHSPICRRVGHHTHPTRSPGRACLPGLGLAKP
eukprot:scaffold15568_cov152-Isochrysis_galbana.AAC.3